MSMYKPENPEKYRNAMKVLMVKCKTCGHTSVMPVYVDQKICGYCAHKMQNDSKEYFKYKIKKEMEK